MALSPLSRVLRPAPRALPQSLQPPRAGKRTAGLVRLHQLSSSLGLLAWTFRLEVARSQEQQKVERFDERRRGGACS